MKYQNLILTVIMILITINVMSREIIVRDTIIPLDQNSIQTLMRNQFNSLVIGSGDLAPINSVAALDINGNKVTFSPAFVLNDNSILSLTFAGQSDERFLPISNRRLDKNFSMKASIHVLLNKKPSLSYDIRTLQKYKEKQKKILLKYLTDSLSIEENPINKKLNRNKFLLTKKRDSILFRINTLSDQIQELSKLTPENQDSISREIKYINEQLIKTRIDSLKNRDELRIAIIQLKDTVSTIAQKNNLHNDYKRKIKENNLTDFELESFRLSWISGGFALRSSSFKMYFPDEPFLEQIKNRSYLQPRFEASFSHYRWSSELKNTLFFKVGIIYDKRTNLEQLISHDLVEYNLLDSISIGTNSFMSRGKIKTCTAYEGVLNENVDNLELSTDLYIFLSIQKSIFIHFGVNGRYTNITQPRYNLVAGIGIPIKNKKSKSPLINTELQYQFIDIFRSTKSANQIYKQSGIGISFTVPFNFNNTK